MNLAYKAAQLAAPEKAGSFLRALRHAAVIDRLPITHYEIIMKIVRETGINEEAFNRYYHDGSAEAALNEDLSFARRLGIRSLPTYLIQYKDKAILIQSFDYNDFSAVFSRITTGE